MSSRLPFFLSFLNFYGLEMCLMHSRQFALGALLSTFAILTVVPAFGTTFTPVDFTGFNRDVIYGPGGTHGGYADAADKNYWRIYAAGTTATDGTIRNDGLPCGNTFTSLGNSDHTYALAVAGGDSESKNVLWLTPSSATGTLTLTTPGKYSNIGVIAAAPDGGATGTIRLNYADATSTSATFSYQDWYQSSQPTNAAYKGGILAYGGNNSCVFADYGVSLYLIETVLTADSTKTLTNITFTQTGGSGNVDFFGISGAAVPEPSAVGLTLSGMAGLLAYAWRKRK
jgi:hypothetical protein